MPHGALTTVLLLSLIVALSGCALDRWGYDEQGVRLVERQTDFIFEIEAPKAHAMGCTGEELCPKARALLEERMKTNGYCGKGYSIGSVGWGKGLLIVNGPCQRT